VVTFAGGIAGTAPGGEYESAVRANAGNLKFLGIQKAVVHTAC
jgi:hypothetical protein